MVGFLNGIVLIILLFCLVTQSCLTLATPWTVACQAPLSMGILQARILEWVALLQGIFPTQGSNWGLLYCRQILYCLSEWEFTNFYLEMVWLLNKSFSLYVWNIYKFYFYFTFWIQLAFCSANNNDLNSVILIKYSLFIISY